MSDIDPSKIIDAVLAGLVSLGGWSFIRTREKIDAMKDAINELKNGKCSEDKVREIVEKELRDLRSDIKTIVETVTEIRIEQAKKK
ncbi:MAG: hypothetical protein CMH23_10475 [Methylophaga sp.]|uniref:hypothetical protein n=1 Tax=Methylophaga sp. TaxID=2024840 RepID=UPI000C90AB16|nr:hypothetical protein [Methylophaga sp.]MBN46884.1 hypothetical protein [Methylophaga sp.]